MAETQAKKPGRKKKVAAKTVATKKTAKKVKPQKDSDPNRDYTKAEIEAMTLDELAEIGFVPMQNIGLDDAKMNAVFADLESQFNALFDKSTLTASDGFFLGSMAAKAVNAFNKHEISRLSRLTTQLFDMLHTSRL